MPYLLQEHYDSAIYHFQQLLERTPDHFAAMTQLVDLMRRAGRLEDVPPCVLNVHEPKALPCALMGLRNCQACTSQI